MHRSSQALLAFVLVALFPRAVSAQTVRTLYDEVKSAYNGNDFRTTINLCERIIARCQDSNPDAECQFTDVMKNVYRFKGFAEYKVYSSEYEPMLLDNAIESLMQSYELYGDPDISFNFGYMQSLRAIRSQNGRDLEGLVNAWRGILGLYANQEWRVSDDLLEKLKIYILQADELTVTPPDSAHTTGKFAGFMIRLACNLAEKRSLSGQDSTFFSIYRQRALEDEYNLRGNEWRARGYAAQKEFKANPTDSTFRITRDYFELAYQYSKSAERRAEMLKELAKVALFMEKNGRNSDPEMELLYSRERSNEAYALLTEQRANISPGLEREIKRVYGHAIFRLVDYYFSLADSTDRINAYHRAKRIGEELLTPLGPEGRVQKFQWDGFEELYLKLSDVGYELGDRQFAVDMVDKAWKAALRTHGLRQSNLCTHADMRAAEDLIRFARVYRQIGERFGLQSVLHWLRPILSCLADRATVARTN